MPTTTPELASLTERAQAPLLAVFPISDGSHIVARCVTPHLFDVIRLHPDGHVTFLPIGVHPHSGFAARAVLAAFEHAGWDTEGVAPSILNGEG